ncbi:MAG: phosphatase PAP2 family protein [Acidothermaceae bacterium]
MTLQKPLPDNGRVLAPPSSDADPGSAGRWVCVSCRAANPIDADVCEGCGVSFAALLLADDEPVGKAIVGTVKRTLAGLRELGLIVGLFVLWRIVSQYSTHVAGAFARGRWLWHVERALHLPSEVGVQAQVLGHPLVVQALNVFYLAAHIGGMALFLPWMFFRHREQYSRWRNAILAFTGISLLVQFVSMAPPRLLPQFGFVDTGAAYHQSAYQGLGPGFADQLSTMPSIHVGWSLLIAIAVIATSRSRLRWAIVAHPIVTSYAVVATANHFWLDAVAAAGLVAAVIVVQNRVASRSALPKRANCR